MSKFLRNLLAFTLNILFLPILVAVFILTSICVLTYHLIENDGIINFPWEIKL